MAMRMVVRKGILMRKPTNVTIRDDIRLLAKEFCKSRNLSLSEVVEDLLADFLSKAKKETGRPTSPAPLALLSMSR